MALPISTTLAIKKSKGFSFKFLAFVGMSILFSGLINLVLPVRIFYCILLTVAILFVNHEVKGHSNRNHLLVPILFLVSTAFWINFINDASPVTKEVLTRLIILFPLSMILGAVLVKSKELGSFLSGYSNSIFLIVLFIPFEFLVGPLVERNPNYFISDRFGFSRVSFFAEHPLILASHITLMTSLFAFSIVQKSRFFKVLLVVACISTLSLGPSLITISLIYLFRYSSATKIGKYLVALTSSLLLIFIFLAFKGISPNILTNSTFGISLNYRAIIYGDLIPKSLGQNPFGYGLEGLREGLFKVNLSTYSVDLSKSIDSQPALLILQGGWILLLAYLILCAFLLKRVWESEYRAYPALISILLGFFVPIQSFTSTLVIQGILIGFAISRKADERK